MYPATRNARLLPGRAGVGVVRKGSRRLPTAGGTTSNYDQPLALTYAQAAARQRPAYDAAPRADQQPRRLRLVSGHRPGRSPRGEHGPLKVVWLLRLGRHRAPRSALPNELKPRWRRTMAAPSFRSKRSVALPPPARRCRRPGRPGSSRGNIVFALNGITGDVSARELSTPSGWTRLDIDFEKSAGVDDRLARLHRLEGRAATRPQPCTWGGTSLSRGNQSGRLPRRRVSPRLRPDHGDKRVPVGDGPDQRPRRLGGTSSSWGEFATTFTPRRGSTRLDGINGVGAAIADQERTCLPGATGTVRRRRSAGRPGISSRRSPFDRLSSPLTSSLRLPRDRARTDHALEEARWR